MKTELELLCMAAVCVQCVVSCGDFRCNCDWMNSEWEWKKDHENQFINYSLALIIAICMSWCVCKYGWSIDNWRYMAVQARWHSVDCRDLVMAIMLQYKIEEIAYYKTLKLHTRKMQSEAGADTMVLLLHIMHKPLSFIINGQTICNSADSIVCVWASIA